ncbi:hypothetical protein MRB53_002740 [Persea americana]|uniref:Uncharacterized protein n=1 Tax=Persea americana TaxID=3435 RepID=A0ACC2MVD0_PERAE|nr:hypothetical protein MRB53_002740 [Persea americana]
MVLSAMSHLVPGFWNSSTNTEDGGIIEIESWDSSSDCCQWKSVTCDLHLPSRPITALDLSGLVGSLATAASILTPLFRIRNLARLDISFNSLQGEISGDRLANLTRLVRLDMRCNNFNGSIPSQLFHLRNLEYLDLGSDSLSGNLISDVGALKNLRFFNLQENFLDGEIPIEMGNLSQLQQLSLRQNRFSAPAASVLMPLFQIRSLVRLDISPNSLQGELPTHGLAKLTRLVKLDMGSNNFHGSFPNQIFHLGNRQYLDMSDTFSSPESIPSLLLKMKELQVLDLRNNSLSSGIPDEIGNLANISLLALSLSNLIGGIPASIKQMDRLHKLRLDRNSFSGEIPAWLFDIKGLKTLFLGRNKFTWNNSDFSAHHQSNIKSTIAICEEEATSGKCRRLCNKIDVVLAYGKVIKVTLDIGWWSSAGIKFGNF